MSNAAWKESISLEETNKIRVSLGLKPLSDSAPSTSTPDSIAEENLRKRREQEAKESAANVLKTRIDKARNTLERGKKLVGVGLGADDADAIKNEDGATGASDSKAWVKHQKKRAKELAAKRAKELEEMDKRFAEEGLAKYGEEDLKGIKVSHGQDDFEEGEDTVLTLKDSRVLDDEDDELHNLNISENSKTAEALAQKKKGKPVYTGYDDDEFAAGGAKKGVLNKYDEEIEGREETGFRLGGAPVPSKAGKGKAREEDLLEKERVKLNLDYTKSFTTDYLQADEAGFKPKKKKKRPTRVTSADSDEERIASTSMDTSTAGTASSSTPRYTNLDSANLIDDDDLQASLARSRREINKKKIAEMRLRSVTAVPPPIKMEIDSSTYVKVESDDEDAPVLLNPSGYIDAGRLDTDVAFDTLDDTSEFVRNISLASAAAKISTVAASTVNGSATNGNGTPSIVKEVVQPGTSTVIKQEVQDVPLSELTGGWGVPREDGEESDDGGDTEMADAEMFEGEVEEKPSLLGAEGDFGGTAGEALVSQGLASTLNLLRHQGLLEVRTPEQLAEDQARRKKDAWLALQRKGEADREEEKKSIKAAGSSKDQYQRELDNKARDRRDAERAMEAMKSYNPVVDIKYQDEFGRNETPKEAWKRISHAFHGHGSGTTNTGKRLKKIEKELAAKAMSAGDTPLSSAAAFAERSARMGSATMILSVGNKGAAPIQEEMLDSLNKERLLNKKKVKASASKTPGTNTSLFSDIPMRSLPLPSNESSSTPPVRAGFAPVRGFSSATESGGSGSANLFAVPMSVKRKPVADADGAPGSKK